MEHMDPSLEYARQLDSLDELAGYRQAFHISDPHLIYLDGNSLGRLPRATLAHLQRAIEGDWGERLIRGWNEGWLELANHLGDQIGQLVGAAPGQVLVSDSTSVNLFKLAAAALRARPGRTKIVSDVFNFPSDLYILQGLVEWLGGKHRLELIPSRDNIHIELADVAAAIDEETALVCLTHVAFKSAYLYDMGVVTQLAHQAGAMMLWDLSHSTGAVPLDLDGYEVDLAIGCSYKYLNGGPGAPAFLYVQEELQDTMLQPIWGWFASQRMFNFDLGFTPADGINRFRVGTPPILSMQAIQPAIELTLQVGMPRLRAKSLRQTEYLIYLAQTWLEELGFRLGSPNDPARRGSHVSLCFPEAYRICRALIDGAPGSLRVIPDFRAPDNIRLGIAPLYTTYEEIQRALWRIKEIVEGRLYEQFPLERQVVT